MATGGVFDKLRPYCNEGLHWFLEGPLLYLFDGLTLYVEATEFSAYPLNMGMKACDATKKGEERVLYLDQSGGVANFDLGVRPFIYIAHFIRWKELIASLPDGQALLDYINGKTQEPPRISAEVPAINIFDIFEGFQDKKCEMTIPVPTLATIDAILQGAPYIEP